MIYNKSPKSEVTVLALVLLGLLLLIPLASLAADVAMQEEMQEQTQEQTPYSMKGADTCLKCHDEDYSFQVTPIFYTRHGNPQDPRSPMAQFQCESCHGPGGNHELEPFVGQKRAPIIAFGRKSSASVRTQNNMCLQCHKGNRRIAWAGSVHQRQELLCVDCHVLHVRQDPVLSNTRQANTCYRCHRKQRAEFERNSAHPVRFGKMQCTQCHNPHGTATASLLLESTNNANCYRCHAEKRGPFLWAHAPVSEDCGICHEYHGSNHSNLLKKRPPLLCQQCHTVAGHPSLPYGTSGLADQNPNPFLLTKSCLNCHFQVHGSNHPSGVKLMR